MSATRPNSSAPNAEASRGGFHQTLLNFAYVPKWLEQRHNDADDEEIVCVGEETHAGDEHDLPVIPGDLRVVHLAEVVSGSSVCHGIPRSKERWPVP
jgi:hypothetical protein